MSVTDTELDQLEKQIEAKKDEETVGPVAPPPVAEQSAPEIAAADGPPAPQPPSPGPEPENPPDAAEWVKKKGWKTPEDAARSMLALERAFHEKNQELNRLKSQPPVAPGWPAYQPPENPYSAPTPGYQAPPAYAPPQNPYAPQPAYGYAPAPAPRLTKAQVAASYNMAEDDFDRVMPLVRDLTEVQMRQLGTEFRSWKDQTEKANAKNADLANVMSDPAFHHPDVQFEMNELFTKQPDKLDDRRPFSSALEKALTNIARRQMTGASRPLGTSLPTEPPKGGGHSGGGLPGKRGFGAGPSMQEFESKSAEEQEKILKSMNAVKTYQDMA